MRLPRRRLVLIGEPGAGKSGVLLLLTLGLLARRTPTDPVPVLFFAMSTSKSGGDPSDVLPSRFRPGYLILLLSSIYV